jgi:CHAD domain-containing protein
VPAKVKQRPASRTGAKRSAELLRRLNAQARRALKSDTAESVHDLRVAIRRFVQTLQVFKSLLPGKDRKKVRHRLRGIMARAGAVRDCDVTLQLIAGQQRGAVRLRSRCETERRAAGHKLAQSLRRWIEHNSLPWTAEKKPISVDESSKEVLPLVARECLSRGFAAAKGASPGQLHRFRLSTKKLRYTVELFASPDAENLRAWLDQIKTIQTLLGDVNDCETARRIASRLGGGKKLDAQLRKEQAKRVKSFRRHWTEELAREWQRQAGPEATLLSA